MTVNITWKGVLKVLGWIGVAVFWFLILYIVMFFLTSEGDSGAGYAFLGLMMAFLSTWYLWPIPLGIVIYGVRTDKDSLWKVLLCWGTIALVVYSAILVFSVQSIL